MSQQDEISNMVKFYNRLMSMVEWNSDMERYFEQAKNYEKSALHGAAAGALHAAAMILEQDYIKDNEKRK